jgi:ketosteroid isomerase-like protein
MSQEKVEIVRQAFAAFKREGPEGFLPFLDPQVTVFDPDLPGGGEFKGHDGFLAFMGQVLDSFEDYLIEAEEVFDAGDRVVVFSYHRGMGKSSGAPFELRDAQVWAFDEAGAVRVDLYLDRSMALEAAGLSE